MDGFCGEASLRLTKRVDALASNHINMNARVWGGIHFRDATVKGVALGRKVAHWTLKRYFLAEN